VPEGHVVHVDARRFGQRLRGHTVRASSPQGRFAAGAAALDGRRLTAAEAYGKHLFLRFGGRSGPPLLHVHLGLIGGWNWYDGSGELLAGRRFRGPDDSAVRLRLRAGRGAAVVTAELRGAMLCELIDMEHAAMIHTRLGPDPIRGNADSRRGWERLHRSSAALGTLLLRQDVVAGAGLIWRCEAPFAAHIDPRRPGRAVTEIEWQAIWAALQTMMRAAVRRGGAERTTRSEHRASWGDELYLFRRGGEPCRVCGTPIESQQMGGRLVWWCPSCQPY